MENQNVMLAGVEFMGDNLRTKLKFCGANVRLYPLCKIIRAENAELDNDCKILDNVWIDAGKSLKVGKHTMITWFVLIEGGDSLAIGDRVFVGPGSKILTGTYELDGYYSSEFLPEGCHKNRCASITIEDDAYIGANCTILPGVTIGEGAVVGANSLVTRDLEPWGVYVGSPCKKIRDRIKPSSEMVDKVMKEIDWSNHL